MAEASNPYAKYIETSFDEFRDVTTVQHRETLGRNDGLISFEPLRLTFRLRQVIQKTGTDVVLDLHSKAEDWFNPDRITFNCDQQNLISDYHDSNSNADHIGDTLWCFENGYFPVSPEVLESICSCSVLKVRVSGRTLHDQPEPAWCKKFQEYCRQFYYGAINPPAGTAANTVSTPPQEGAASPSVDLSELPSKAMNYVWGIAKKSVAAIVLVYVIVYGFRALTS